MRCTIGYRIIAIGSRTSPPRNQRIYAANRAGYRRALAAARREGADYTVDSVCRCPVPHLNDAAGWDKYRLMHGITAW